jgi:hypothetical protein
MLWRDHNSPLFLIFQSKMRHVSDWEAFPSTGTGQKGTKRMVVAKILRLIYEAMMDFRSNPDQMHEDFER